MTYLFSTTIRRFYIFFALVAGICIVYYMMWPDAPMMSNDSIAYIELRDDLRDGTQDVLSWRTPGYPLLLAFLPDVNPRTIFLAQLLVHGFTMLVVMLVLRKSRYHWKFVFAVVLVCFLPQYIEHAGYVLTENLTTLLLVLVWSGIVFWFEDRSRTWLIVGAVAAASVAIVRPSFIMLSLAITAAALISLPWRFADARYSRATRLAFAFSYFAAFMLVAGGVISYNWQHFGYCGITPFGGAGLTTKTMPFIEQLPLDDKLRAPLMAARAEELVREGSPHSGHSFIFRAMPALYKLYGGDIREIGAALMKMNVTLIKQNPLGFIYEGVKAFPGFFWPGVGELASRGGFIPTFFMMMSNMLIMMMFMVCSIMWMGFIALKRRHFGGEVSSDNVRIIQISWLTVLFLVSYTAVVSCMFGVGIPRYRAPLDILMLVGTISVLTLVLQLKCAFVAERPARSFWFYDDASSGVQLNEK